MKQLVIEPHYLGSLEYYSLLLQFDNVILEVNDHFQKQTYRNRCYILGSNGVLPLIVPVSYSSDTITKDVVIDNNQRWKKDHWGAFYSSYGKAPFFEYFADLFSQIWKKEHKYLLELTLDFLKLTNKLLQANVKMTCSEKKEGNFERDCRNVILPKKNYSHRKIYQPRPYSQLFGDNFIPNLSIVDLIMCEGPQAHEIISASFLTAGVDNPKGFHDSE